MTPLPGEAFVAASSDTCHVVSYGAGQLSLESSWQPSLGGGASKLVGCAFSPAALVLVAVNSDGTRAFAYTPAEDAAHGRRLTAEWSHLLLGSAMRRHRVAVQHDVLLLVTAVGAQGAVKTARIDLATPPERRERVVRWAVQSWVSPTCSRAPSLANGLLVAVDGDHRLLVVKPRKRQRTPVPEQQPDDGADAGDGSGNEDPANQQRTWDQLVGQLAPLPPW